MRTEDPIVHNHLLFNSLSAEELGLVRLIGDKGGRYDVNSLAHAHHYTVDEVAETVSSLTDKGICELSLTSGKYDQNKIIVTNITLTDRGVSFYNIDLGILPSPPRKKPKRQRLIN